MSITDLHKKLKSEDPEEKVRVIKELVALKSREAGKVLVEALKEESHEPTKELMRKGIAYLKKYFSDPSQNPNEDLPALKLTSEVIDKVKGAITSSNPEEEKKAIKFIVKNNVRELVPFLVDSSINRNHEELMLASIKVIEKFNAKEHKEDLLYFLKHQESRLIIASLKTIDSIGLGLEMYSLIAELCMDEREGVAQQALVSMRILADQELGDAQDFLDKLAETQKTPSIFVPEGMDELLPRLRNEIEQDKLAEQKKKRSQAAKLFKYKEDLESDDPEKRKIAITKLASAQDPEAVELISQILTQEEDVHVIATGISSLASLGVESAVPTILNYLDHADARVRANAVDSLTLILGSDTPKPMLERMLKDPNHRVRANTILAIFSTKPNECFLALNTLANSADTSEQMSALYCFEALQQDTHLGLLQRFFVGPEGRIRDKSREILENWKGDKTIVGFILNEPPEKFHELFRRHLDKKRAESHSVKASTDIPEPSMNEALDSNIGENEPEQESDFEPANLEETLFSKLKKWLGFRRKS